MTRLRFSYQMRIDFSEPVTRHRFTLKCIPGTDERQRIEDLQVRVEPNYFLEWERDSFDNECIYGYCEIPHDRFAVDVTGIAVTGLAHFETAEDEYKLGMYKYASHYTKPGSALVAYYHELQRHFREKIHVPEKQSGAGFPYAWALFLTGELYRELHYERGLTGIHTTAEEAMRIGGGVCQDYAHIMIALCHMAGIPARYVVGMLEGEGESHAWVEIYDGGVWMGLDPTNNLVVTSHHIKISSGRDYQDCLINQGVFTGMARQNQSIHVTVEEIPGEKGSLRGGQGWQ